MTLTIKMGSKRYIFVVQVTRQLSIDIINGFVKKGCEVELLTGVIESNYAALDNSVNVKLLNKYDNRTGFKRIYTWVIFTFVSMLYILFRSRKKELILVTTPPFVVFTGWFFYLLRRQKYHLVIWDLYPDVLVKFGVLKPSSWLLKCWNSINRWSFKRSSNLFTLGTHLSRGIANYTNKTPVIIPNWVDTDFLKPMDKSKNPFAAKYGLKNKLVVMYSGNLGLTHDIETIVETANYLKDHSSIHFVIIGDGAKKVRIEKYVRENKLTNVLILPYQEKEILPFSLTCADIGVVTLSQGAETISVPSKTYYTLASGSAVMALASHESELGLLVETHKCGVVLESPKIDEVAQFIVDLQADSGMLNSFKNNARNASLNYTPKNAERYYDYIYG